MKRCVVGIRRSGDAINASNGTEIPTVWFPSMATMAAVLSEDNQALLRVIRDAKPKTLTELATLSGRQVPNLSRTVRIPVHVVERLNKITRAERQLLSEFGREPTLAEIARLTELKVDEVEHIKRLAQTPISLEKCTRDAPKVGDRCGGGEIGQGARLCGRLGGVG